MRRFLFVAATALTFVAGTAHAVDYGVLRENPRVSNGVLSAAVAYHLKENCSRVDERTVRGGLYLFSLRNYAMTLGFTLPELDAWILDEKEQEYSKALAMAYLRSQGLPQSPTDADWCNVARGELNKNTPVPLMVYMR